MEIRVLRYFLAVVREQNISRAAESLHLTQPTLSRQLAELEAEIGRPLFEESYDFSGKTVIPFATSGGSPIEESTDSVTSSAKGATIREGLLVNDTGEIAPWISGLGYAK